MYFSLLPGSQPITVETSRGQGSERTHNTASTVRREASNRRMRSLLSRPKGRYSSRSGWVFLPQV